MKKKIIFIIGPTAVGKSEVAYRLARRIKGEIISADSMQAYKGIPIISQVPKKEWLKAIPHHLIETLSLNSEYSAADFKRRASILIKNIIQRNHIPIIVGGSGLYVKALIDGLFPAKSKNEKLRKRLYNDALKYGNNYLYEKLKDIDGASAAKIHPNDLRRMVRALEIYETTKIPFSKHLPKTVGISNLYDIKQFGLNMDRAKLYDKINERVDGMFDEGLVDEVRVLLKKKLSRTAKAAIGLKEIEEFFKKRYTLSFAKDLVKRNTRHFAKRQITWFRPDKRVKWIILDDLKKDDAIDIIIRESELNQINKKRIAKIDM